MQETANPFDLTDVLGRIFPVAVESVGPDALESIVGHFRSGGTSAEIDFPTVSGGSDFELVPVLQFVAAACAAVSAIIMFYLEVKGGETVPTATECEEVILADRELAVVLGERREILIKETLIIIKETRRR